MFEYWKVLGFDFETEDEYLNFLSKEILPKAQKISQPDFWYYFYKIGNFEFWILEDQNGLATAHLHFTGNSKNQFSIVAPILYLNVNGGFYSWIEPEDSLLNGLAPILFNTPDFWLKQEIIFPQLTTVQLTGYLIGKQYEVEKHRQELQEALDDFFAPDPVVDVEFNEEQGDYNISDTNDSNDTGFYLPIGLYMESEDTPPQPLAEILFKIQDWQIITNPFTQKDLYWIKAKDLFEIDIIAPVNWLNQQPQKDEIIGGTIFLSGKLTGILETE